MSTNVYRTRSWVRYVTVAIRVNHDHHVAIRESHDHHDRSTSNPTQREHAALAHLNTLIVHHKMKYF